MSGFVRSYRPDRSYNRKHGQHNDLPPKYLPPRPDIRRKVPLPTSRPPSWFPSPSPSGRRSSVACDIATDGPLRAASCLRVFVVKRENQKVPPSPHNPHCLEMSGFVRSSQRHPRFHHQPPVPTGLTAISIMQPTGHTGHPPEKNGHTRRPLRWAGRSSNSYVSGCSEFA